jgi:hypothetical protein
LKAPFIVDGLEEVRGGERSAVSTRWVVLMRRTVLDRKRGGGVARSP